MANINTCVLVGRTTRPIELRTTNNGTTVGTLSLAVNRWNGSEEVADFFDCTVWGKQAETMAQYVPKGTQIVVIGSLRQNRWTNDQGQKRSKVVVNVRSFNFADSKKDDGYGGPPTTETPPTDGQGGNDPYLSELDDDEIPF